jgi:hypothetical protein
MLADKVVLPTMMSWGNRRSAARQPGAVRGGDH